MELYTNTKVIISKHQETNNTMPNNGNLYSTITNKNTCDASCVGLGTV